MTPQTHGIATLVRRLRRSGLWRELNWLDQVNLRFITWMEHTRWIVPDSLWQKLLATIQRAIQTLKQSRFREKAIAKGRNVTNHFTESQAPRILRNRITQWAKSEAYLFFVGTMALNQTT